LAYLTHSEDRTWSLRKIEMERKNEVKRKKVKIAKTALLKMLAEFCVRCFFKGIHRIQVAFLT